jgi:hypothetical protein
VLIPLLVLSALVACADRKEAPQSDQKAAVQNGQWGAGVYVDPAWSFARDVTGHRVHVIEQKVECVKCHAPSANKMGPVTPDRCIACHQKEGHIEHASGEAVKRFGAGTKAVCTACHAFTLEGARREEALLKEPPRIALDGGGGAPSYAVESYEASDCKRCHASAQGQLAPVTEKTVHGSQPCLSCHQPHEGPPKSAPCSDCHKEISTTHASAGKSLIETCSTCHEHRHAPAKDAVATCAACHAKEQPIIPATALFAGGHTQCIGCHKPHSFEKKEATACRSCHAQVNVIGAGSIAAHNGCTNCHAPHDVRSSAPAACTMCHKSVHPDHPSQLGKCVGCHDPHPKSTRAASEGIDVNACTSCHKFAESDHGAHRGAACTGCHKPHGFKLTLASVTTCTGCHEARVHQTSLNKGHQACEGCHQGLPHQPEPDKVGCDNCHRKQAGLVKAGHARCIGCHEPHSGAQATPCANCHRVEQQTAPKGHQACLNCHEPHAGLPTLKACPDCHRTEQASAHGRISSGCQTCHRPHGPNGVASVPACSSCHQRESLPGLHAEAKHQPCTICHSGHDDAAAPKRNICLRCHKDRANHFPESPRCAGCHLFTKTP